MYNLLRIPQLLEFINSLPPWVLTSGSTALIIFGVLPFIYKIYTSIESINSNLKKKIKSNKEIIDLHTDQKVKDFLYKVIDHDIFSNVTNTKLCPIKEKFIIDLLKGCNISSENIRACSKYIKIKDKEASLTFDASDKFEAYYSRCSCFTLIFLAFTLFLNTMLSDQSLFFIALSIIFLITATWLNGTYKNYKIAKYFSENSD